MKAATLMALVTAFTLATAQGMQGKDDMKPDSSAKDVQPAADHAAHHPQTPAKQ